MTVASDKSDYLFQLLTNPAYKGFITPTTISTITGKHLIYFLAMFKPKYHYIPNNLKVPDNIVQNYEDTTENCKKLLFDVIKTFQSDPKKKENLEVLNNTIDNKLLLSNSAIQSDIDKTNVLLANNLDDSKLIEMLNELPPKIIIDANNAEKAATDAITKALATPADSKLQFAAKTAADAAIAAATLAKTTIATESARISPIALAALAAPAGPDKSAIEKAAANYVNHAATADAADLAATKTFKTDLDPIIAAAIAAIAAPAVPAVPAAIAAPIDSTAIPTADSSDAVTAAAKKRGDDLAGFINVAPATYPPGDPQKLVAPAQKYQTNATNKKAAYTTTPTITTALEYQAAAKTAVDTLTYIIDKLSTATSATALYYNKSIATLKKIKNEMDELLEDAIVKVATEALKQDNAIISGAATTATATANAAAAEAKIFLNTVTGGDPAWVTNITSTDIGKINRELMTLAQSVHTETINIEKATTAPDMGRYGDEQTKNDETAGREPANSAIGESRYVVGGVYNWIIPPNDATGTDNQKKRKLWRDFRIDRWKLNNNKLKFILNTPDILANAKAYYNTITGTTTADLTTKNKLNIFNDINATRTAYFAAINKIVAEKNSKDPMGPPLALSMTGGGKQYNKKTFKNKQFKRKQTHRNNYFHRTRMHRKQKHGNQTHKK
jgi:hypothetical protein